MIVNRNAQANKTFVSHKSVVDRAAVRRESINGVEHIIVTSKTMPDDIVMNGVMYPANEIETSYKTLERTLAPLEHPVDERGQFLSATDPFAINNFYAGAFNLNVRRENGRIVIDKYINMQEALKTERGKRLLDRIKELEESDSPRPIHTSTAIFLEVEELSKPQTNSMGQPYQRVARNMVFDHDAILLDSIGAAQPHQGVGMAVNAMRAVRNLPLAESGVTWDGAKAVQRVRDKIGASDAPNADYKKYFLWYDASNVDNFGAYKLPFVDVIDGELRAIPAALRNAAARLSQTQGPSDTEKETIRSIIDGYLNRLRNNALSYAERSSALYDALERPPYGVDYLVEVFEDSVIYEYKDVMFSVPYVIDDTTGIATIMGVPVPVELKKEYQVKTNNRGDKMRETLLNALKAAGITVNEDATDDEILAQYTALNSKSKDDAQASGDGDALAQQLNKVLEPVVNRLASLEAQLKTNADAQQETVVNLIVNSGKYPGLTAEALKKLDSETLKTMATNCTPSYGLPLTIINGGKDGAPKRFEMPA